MTGLTFPWAEPPAEGQATEVAEGILWLRLPLPMALDHVNVYALRDGGSWVVVDTGLSTKRTRGLWQTLLDGPLQGLPVSRLIVTHHHPDHVGLAGWFQSQGAELMMTRTAWLYARMLVLDVEERASPEQLAFLRRAGASDEHLSRAQSERPFNFADVVHPMPRGFAQLSEGQVLSIGTRDWTIRLGSGHAPDHATLWSGDGIVLGGDQLLPGISANIGVYATEPDADPLAEWLDSCRRLLPHARPDQLVLPGHKLPYRGLPFRLAEMVAEHEDTLAKLLIRLAEPARATDIFPTLFKREVTPGQFSMALAESLAHLNHLHRKGLIQRSTDDRGAWAWRTG